MNKIVFNLTLAVVTDEIEQIETVLRSYAYHPYQQAFAIPDWRQQLSAYVLSRIPNTYKVIEQTEFLVAPKSVHCCLERRLQIEALLYQGMQQLLQENSRWGNPLVSETLNLCSQYN
jgi:hypothetical protein